MTLKSWAAVALVGLITSGLTAVAPAAEAHRPSPSQTLAHGRYAVGVADYTLGNQAFRTPGLYKNRDPDQGLAPVELTGRVYYPRERSHRPRPMVLMLHGYWPTCADRSAALLTNQVEALNNEWSAAHPVTPAPRDGSTRPEPTPNPRQGELDRIYDRAIAKLYRWPCAKGTPALPSYRGFDYLGRSLAGHGIIAVSISANGINAVDQGSNGQRAALINKHLALWAALTRTGRGPLAGRFTRPGTTHAVHPDFRHAVDLHRIGTLGHSRGGSGVFWQAADRHRSALPPGVRIAAMVALAPAGSGGDADAPNFRVTRLPVMIWRGTCAYAVSNAGDDFLADLSGRPHRPYYRLVVHGANHNFLNTQWSPSSGQVAANDDVDEPGVARPVPGRCTGDDDRSERQLGESDERAASSAYVTAFFLRELAGQRRWQSVLDGRSKPLGARVRVDVRTIPSGAR